MSINEDTCFLIILSSTLLITEVSETPEECEWVKIISNASSVAQFTNNDDGKPSGPAAAAAEVGESSCIASIIIFSDNTISVNYKSVVLDMDGCMEKKKRG